jgi:hypothetical protein
MTTTELTSLAARDEIEIAAIRHPGDLTTAGRRPTCVDWAPEAA